MIVFLRLLGWLGCFIIHFGRRLVTRNGRNNVRNDKMKRWDDAFMLLCIVVGSNQSRNLRAHAGRWFEFVLFLFSSSGSLMTIYAFFTYEHTFPPYSCLFDDSRLAVIHTENTIDPNTNKR